MASSARNRLICTWLAATSIVSAPAWAQEPASASQSEVEQEPQPEETNEEIAEEEVIVTAQRRSERLIDVPVSITAVTNEEIEQRNVQRLNEFQFSVPGLSLIDSGPGTERTQLRGVSQFVGAPTVGTYLDELSVNPQASGGGLDIRLFDLERIEILRGPQPTLYGEGSLGGTIRYIAASPDLDEFIVRGQAQIGFIEDGGQRFRTDAAVSMPLVTDVLGIRLAAAYESDGGFVDTPLGEDQNDSRVWTVRGKLLFEPTDALSVSLLGVHQDNELDDRPFAFSDLTDTSPLPDASRSNYDIANLVLRYDLGPATLTGSSGYLSSRGFGDTDLTYFFSQLGIPLVSGTRSFVDFERFSQELRIASNDTGPFSYLVGAVYTDDDNQLSPLPYNVSTRPTRPAVAEQRTRSKALSLYGEVGYDFEPVQVTIGGRYFRDRRRFDVPTGRVGSATFESFNPRLNVKYDTGNGQVYASAAKGFRSGGFNQPNIVPPAPASFGPEDFWSYEIGTKQQLLDRRVTIDASIYYSTWDDIQSVTPIGLNPIVLGIANSGEASGFGGELAVNIVPFDDFRIALTYAYAGMEYDRGIATHQKGDPLDGVPKHTASVGLDYRRALSAGVTGFGRLDLGYTSGARITTRNFAIQKTGDPAVGIIAERFLLNGRAGAEFGGFELFGFFENVFNETGSTFAGATILNERPIRPTPRVLGVGGSFRF